jgi:hypothetical protein
MVNSEDLNSVIEWRDPELDAEAIMREIRERIRQRRTQAEAQGLDFDAIAQGEASGQATGRFSRELYGGLRQMRLSYNKVNVGPVLTTMRVPLVGGLLQAVRAQLHQLVLFYVNMLASRQSLFNQQVVETTTKLVQELDHQNDRDEIAALRARVEQLEKRLDDTGGKGQ